MHERDLFNDALEIADPVARRAHLDSVCGGNLVLRARIDRLLDRAVGMGNFLEQPAADLCSDVAPGLLTENNVPSVDAGDHPTLTWGTKDDTGQSVVIDPSNLKAASAHAVSAATIGPNPEALASGTLFGRYQVERVLGSGGMGVVYLVQDLRLCRRVALKIPKFDADGKLHLSERFRQEARTMASVQHRNLCPIFDVGEHDGTQYLTMAFIDGETLAQVIKNWESHPSHLSAENADRTCMSLAATPRFTAQQIAELIRKLALALDAAHLAGVVHRDLKPGNVILDHSGEPILMDFGLAWMVHETDSRVTLSGAIIGTPAYMSPEQAEGEPDKIGAPSDIYSLGAILYELLVGQPIHSGTVNRVLYKLMHESPIRPSQIRGNVNPRLEAICCKAISRRPEDRFATAGEFADALSEFLANPGQDEAIFEPSATPNLPVTIRAVSPQDRTSMIGEQRGQHLKPPRSRWRTALAGFAAFVLLAVFLVVTTRDGTVEVTSPDGKLPEDLQVVVSRNGEEIELLQADNHWSAKLVHGQYQVQLKGGADRFEITTSQLTINRLGRAVVRLEIRPQVAVPSEIGPHPEALTGTGPHLPLAQIGGAIAYVGPMYIKTSTSFTGTWSAGAAASWRGTFTGRGLVPRENTGSHSTEYDFSGLRNKVLPAGTAFCMTDLDTIEYLKLKAYDSTHTVISSPWLNRTPLSQWGKGTGSGSPSQILSTDLPGWEWTESTQTYVFKGTSIEGNPNVSFALSSREAIGFLEVTREITGFNFHLMAPSAAVVPNGGPVDPPSRAITPFDHKQARTHQVEWAEHLGVPVEYTNTVGMQFILIPPGEFMMGSTPAEIAEAIQALGGEEKEDQTWQIFAKTESPRHQVSLTQPYYMGVHEVTQAQYEQVLGKDRNLSCFAPLSFGSQHVTGLDTTRHPVEMASWNDAAEFCAKLSQKEDLEPFYLREGETVAPLDGTGYRLPTEAQWEHACRAGTTTRYCTGDRLADLDAVGWFSLNSGGRTHAVGEKNANPFGLYDMHGNVEEWIQDHYRTYPEEQQVNPKVTDATDPRHVTRGGFWTYIGALCRSSHRFARAPESRFNYSGFRVVLEVDAVKAATTERKP